MRTLVALGAGAIAMAAMAWAVGLVAAPGFDAPPRASTPSAVTPRPAPTVASGVPSAAVADGAQRARTAAPLARRYVGRCVDWSTAAALPDCEVRIAAELCGRSDTSGHFTFVAPVGANALDVQIAAPGRITIARRIDLSPDGEMPDGEVLGDVRLRRGTGVTGALVDEQQRPCQDVPLQLHVGTQHRRDDGWTERYTTATRTSTDGTFVLPTPLPSGVATVHAPGAVLRPPTTFVLEEGVDRHLRLVGRAAPAPGTPGEAAAGAGVMVSVLDADTGEAIEHYALQCAPTIGVRSARAGTRTNDGLHPGGRTWLENVAAGGNTLLVWPHDRRWLPGRPLVVDPERCGGFVEVALPRATTCAVRVVTRSGRTLPFVHVELLAPAPGAVVRDLEDLLAHGGSRGPVSIRLARARTGHDGVASLRWFDDPEPLLLRVSGPGLAPHEEPDVRLGPDGATVQVEDTGSLQLMLRGAGPARVLLREVGGARQLPASWSPPLQLKADRLAIDVPEGRWQVTLLTAAASDGGAPIWLPAPEPFATVRIVAAERTELNVDANELVALGELNGRAFVDGEPASHIVLLCGAADDAGTIRALHAVDTHTDAGGAFRFDHLRTGHYMLQLRLSCSGREISVPIGDWRRLGAGERFEQAPIVVSTAPVAIRLRDAAGRAVVLGQLVLRADSGLALLAAPDAAGEVHFDRVPTASYQLRFRGEQDERDLGRLDVVGGGLRVHTVEIR